MKSVNELAHKSEGEKLKQINENLKGSLKILKNYKILGSEGRKEVIENFESILNILNIELKDCETLGSKVRKDFIESFDFFLNVFKDYEFSASEMQQLIEYVEKSLDIFKDCEISVRKKEILSDFEKRGFSSGKKSNGLDKPEKLIQDLTQLLQKSQAKISPPSKSLKSSKKEDLQFNEIKSLQSLQLNPMQSKESITLQYLNTQVLFSQEKNASMEDLGFNLQQNHKKFESELELLSTELKKNLNGEELNVELKRVENTLYSIEPTSGDEIRENSTVMTEEIATFYWRELRENSTVITPEEIAAFDWKELRESSTVMTPEEIESSACVKEGVLSIDPGGTNRKLVSLESSKHFGCFFSETAKARLEPSKLDPVENKNKDHAVSPRTSHVTYYNQF